MAFVSQYGGSSTPYYQEGYTQQHGPAPLCDPQYNQQYETLLQDQYNAQCMQGYEARYNQQCKLLPQDQYSAPDMQQRYDPQYNQQSYQQYPLVPPDQYNAQGMQQGYDSQCKYQGYGGVPQDQYNAPGLRGYDQQYAQPSNSVQLYGEQQRQYNGYPSQPAYQQCDPSQVYAPNQQPHIQMNQTHQQLLPKQGNLPQQDLYAPQQPRQSGMHPTPHTHRDKVKQHLHIGKDPHKEQLLRDGKMAFFSFKVHAANLPPKDITGKSDPYLVFNSPLPKITGDSKLKDKSQRASDMFDFSYNVIGAIAGAGIVTSAGIVAGAATAGLALIPVAAGMIGQALYTYAHKLHKPTSGYQEIYVSEKIKRTLNPNWPDFVVWFHEEYLDYQSNKSEEMLLQVWDWDKFSPSDFMCSCLIPIKELLYSNGRQLQFNLTNARGQHDGTLFITTTRVPPPADLKVKPRKP